MSVGSLLVGLALLVLLVPIVAAPLRRESARVGRRAAAPPPASEDGLRSALVALRDLDFDYQTAKVSESDYAELRRSLVGRAARAFESPSHAAAEKGSPAGPLPELQQVECQACGGRLRDGARFCSHCGHRVEPGG